MLPLPQTHPCLCPRSTKGCPDREARDPRGRAHRRARPGREGARTLRDSSGLPRCRGVGCTRNGRTPPLLSTPHSMSEMRSLVTWRGARSACRYSRFLLLPSGGGACWELLGRILTGGASRLFVVRGNVQTTSGETPIDPRPPAARLSHLLEPFFLTTRPTVLSPTSGDGARRSIMARVSGPSSKR